MLDTLNALPEADFVSALKDIFEHSPWVPAAVAGLRPFGDMETLHSALAGAMWRADQPTLLALLNAHPELAGKEADAGTLTAHSTGEQDSVGLNRLTAEEKARIVDLNRAYRAKHGFPFIIAVKLRTKSQIFAAFESRLAAPTEAEFSLALAEVGKIARMRLDALSL